ncbi:MAG: LLM class flavin-dependent oxidoreductase [Nitrososphaerota archaeon]|nr:LLM class flavin-dependent oxidoreductase [Nitrososphaerota archaeon]
MDFGAAISTAREGLFYPEGFASRGSFVEVAKKAEELGFACLWGNDHITTQGYIKARGEHPNFFEPMITFSHLSAVTKKIKFGTAVVVGPTRHPVTLAKQAITLDHLSSGRFLLGVGLGAYREEFEAFGGRGNRGEILDEMTEGLALLFGRNVPASYSGKHFRFKDVEMMPRPYTNPFPFYIGGNSPNVLTRVGKYAEGWIPASMSASDLEKFVPIIAETAREHKRNPSKIAVAPESICGIDRDPKVARKKFLDSPVYRHLISLKDSTLKDIPLTDDELVSRNFIGTPAEVIKKLEPYEGAGATQVWFDFLGSTNGEVLAQMELFAKEVMPSF